MANRTVTIGPGKTYATLQDAITTEKVTYADLVANSMILTFECYNMEDTTPVNIQGYTTSINYYIKVIAAENHNGVWGTSSYRIKCTTTDTNQSALSSTADYMVIRGIQIELDVAHDQCKGITLNGADNCILDKCIVKQVVAGGTNNATHGIFFDGCTGVSVTNCIVYDFVHGTGVSSGIRGGSGYQSYGCWVYNNTIVNCYRGIWDYDVLSLDVKNNITQDCTDGYFQCGTTTGKSDYNISDLAADAPGGNSKNETEITFAGAANYHLSSGETDAIGQALNLYNDTGHAFQDDIDGNDRGGSSAQWDIGADEYMVSYTPINVSTISDDWNAL